jgi:murein DD-endopeptidase MepM/ murein hydrolase activator NlpD
MATYKVRKGDTLSEIAESVGITLKELLDLNPQIKNKNLINPGQVITTSKPTSAAPPAPTKTPVPSSTGGNDAQNAARLAAEEKAKAYALSPAGMRAAADKIIAEQAAADAAKKAKLELDPDVIAARKLQEEAAAEVKRTQESQAQALADLEAFGNAMNEGPQVGVTQELRDATQGLDTNVGFTAGAVGAREVTGIPEDYTTVNGILNFKGSPFSGQYNGKYYTNGKESSPKGPAWTWNGKEFVQPPMPKDGKTYTWNDAQGWVASTLNTATITATQTDAIAGVIALLGSYGIGDLGDAITRAIINGYSADTIQLIMQDPNSNDPLAVAFQKRFPANKVLASQGKAVLSPGEYLAAERRYTEIMQSYGVAGLATRATLSEFIGNSISATEVSDRIGLAVDRVQNADAETKKMLATYYPMLNVNDIVTAMLNPKEGLPALQRKVQIAEIGGAALAQGLNTSINAMSMKSDLYSNIQPGALGAQQLAELGVTKAQARLKYEQVAEVTPRGEFLSAISPGEDYTRLQAEQEAFLGMASAKRARENLVKQEQGRFAGSAGTSKASLTSSTKGMLY